MYFILKRISFLALLSMLITEASAQVLTHDPAQYQATLQQLHKMEGMVQQLQEQLSWDEYQTRIQAEQFALSDSLADEGWNARRLHILGLARESAGYVQALALDTLPGFSDDDLSTGQDALFFPDPSSASLEDALERQQSWLEQRKQMLSLIRRYRIALAQTYLQLAQAQSQQAEQLRQYVLSDDLLNMSDGERLAVLQQVEQSQIQALMLREKAMDLYQKALQEDDLETRERALRQRERSLERIRQEARELIPGYNRP